MFRILRAASWSVQHSVPHLGAAAVRSELRLAKLGIRALDGSWLLALIKIPVESKLHSREARGAKKFHLK